MSSIEHPLRLGGAIIAGGKARRLGGLTKGLIAHDDGRSVVERLLGELADVGVQERVIVSNDRAPYAAMGTDVIGDLRPGEGPLAGIEAALSHLQGRCDATLILACDMPSVSANELQRLVDALWRDQLSVAYARTDENFCHTLCVAVDNRILSRVSATLDAGIRRPIKVWTSVPHKPVWFPDDTVFRNLNTKEDLTEWRRDAGLVSASIAAPSFVREPLARSQDRNTSLPSERNSHQ